MDDPISVLHVDDDPSVAGLTTTFLEGANAEITVETAPSASDGLDRLAVDDIDCIVSDYDMPGQNGLEFLEAVRAEYPDMPFILFTGKGSEEIASEAISAGVTDYLQKEFSADHYTLLANRVQNVVERVRAQHENQRQLEAMETSREGISILDEDGYFTYVNHSFAALYRYPPDELIGEHWEVVSHDEDRDRIRTEILPAIEETGFWNGEMTGLRSDGTTFVEEKRFSTTANGNLICTVFDITEQQKSARQFETLIENIPGMVYRCQNAPGWPMENILGDAEELTGYTPSELESRKAVFGSEIIVSSDREETWHEVQDALATTKPFEITYRIKTKDGTTRWVWERGQGIYDSEGNVEALEGLITDLTKQKAYEQDLERTNAVLSTLIETLPVGILVEDESRTVLAINERLFELFGFDGSPEHIVGADCQSMAEHVSEHCVDPRGFVQRIETVVAERTPTDNEEIAFQSGQIVERSYRPIDLPQGDGHLWMYRDITEEKEQKEQLKHQRNKLEEFASVVSHDIRNPLTVAAGHLELARETSETAHLEEVKRSHDRIERIIDDLLWLAREGRDIGGTHPVVLPRVVENAWRQVETGDALLHTECESSVTADPDRLQQLFENLFRNAIEHGGSAVTVRVGEVDDGFFVEDDGCGIANAKRDLVLEDGYTTIPDGTGYGLSIVRKITEAHDWELELTESITGGARFEFSTDTFQS
ncbi:PAS domain S-box protein [Natrialbaceae archaeon GCM10025810]|uniref:PAS domain S-box protein n=1 Tax=Halovalidus salilacus TaxID=3075124 RepID=UPI0036126696